MVGNIRKLPSGRYQARHIHPTRPLKDDGKRNYINGPATFRTKTDARGWLNSQDALISSGKWADPNTETYEPIFKKYSEEVIAQRNLKESSRKTYLKTLNNHLLPTFGYMRITEISKLRVRQWLAEVSPGAPGARKEAYKVLSLIMRQAEDDELIDRTPCSSKLLDQVTPAPAPEDFTPRRAREIRALTEEEIEQLAKALQPVKGDLVRIMGTLGLRVGEACEIRGTDLKVVEDLGMVLTVSRTFSSFVVSDTTKTGKPREILLPPYFAELFKNKVGSPELLFPSRRGTNISLGRLRSDIDKASTIGHITSHDLRHSANTNLKKRGVPPQIVMQILGHDSASMSAHYTHPDATWQKNVW